MRLSLAACGEPSGAELRRSAWSRCAAFRHAGTNRRLPPPCAVSGASRPRSPWALAHWPAADVKRNAKGAGARPGNHSALLSHVALRRSRLIVADGFGHPDRVGIGTATTWSAPWNGRISDYDLPLQFTGLGRSGGRIDRF